jgi:para-nitrobenzyl esterase
MQQVNVMVTTNYRLRALGFLNLPRLSKDGAGNFGLLDQQAASRWVQATIARFGGDHRKVSIAGQSAGGTSVCTRLASPATTGLFPRAIMSGGCSLQSTSAGQTASQAAGCDVLACLRAKPAVAAHSPADRAGGR